MTTPGLPWPLAWAERAGEDGRHILLDDERGTQLVLTGTAALASPVAFLIPADPDLPRRLDALREFWTEMTEGLARTPEVTPQRRLRLILGLRALDGRATGASYRVLAARLFGADRVPSGAAWKTHDLRSRTLRLVADATALMRGGYRALAGLPLYSA